MKHFRKFTVAILAVAALTPPLASAAAAHADSAAPAKVPALEQIEKTDATLAHGFDVAPAFEARDGSPVIGSALPRQPITMGFLALIAAGLFSVGMVNTRTLRDENLAATKALPAANANNTSDAIDTFEVNPGRSICNGELLVELAATPNLVDAKTITLKVQDSADGVTFADVADIPAITVTGAGGAGGGAVERRFKPPIGLRRHQRLYQAVENAGGDNTAKSGTLSWVF